MNDSDVKEKAYQLLDAHSRSIDTLHDKLAALRGNDTHEKLHDAVTSYKKEHKKFESDVCGTLGVNTR